MASKAYFEDLSSCNTIIMLNGVFHANCQSQIWGPYPHPLDPPSRPFHPTKYPFHLPNPPNQTQPNLKRKEMRQKTQISCQDSSHARHTLLRYTIHMLPSATRRWPLGTIPEGSGSSHFSSQAKLRRWKMTVTVTGTGGYNNVKSLLQGPHSVCLPDLDWREIN